MLVAIVAIICALGVAHCSPFLALQELNDPFEYEPEVTCELFKNSAHTKSSASSSDPSQRKWEPLDQVIEGLMNCFGVPGMAVGVTHNGEEVYKKGYGFRDKAHHKPVNTNTLFGVGSTSKGFNSIMLAKLMQQGQLGSWDTKLADIYPGFKYDDDINVQNYLTFIDSLSHKSGVTRTDEIWASDAVKTSNELVKGIQHMPLQYPFRGSCLYNNIVAAATGYTAAWHLNTTWDELMAQQIFGPLGMTSTTTSTDQAVATGNYAFPYGMNYETGEVQPYPPKVNKVIEKVGPAGSIVSSINDMTKWTRYLLSTFPSGSIDENGIHYVFSPQCGFAGGLFEFYQMDSKNFPRSMHVMSYCLGWLRSEYGGDSMIWHNGGTIGHVTYLAIFPSQNISVIVLSNADTIGGNAMTPILAAVDIVLGRTPYIDGTTACSWPCPWASFCGSAAKRKWNSMTCPAKVVEAASLKAKKSFKATSEKLATKLRANIITDPSEYVGNYVHPTYGKYTIVANGTGIGSLYGNQVCEFAMQTADVFLLNCHADYYLGALQRLIYFERGADGVVKSVAVPDYDYTIPPIVFSKENSSAELFSYPRYVPTIPDLP